MVPEMLRRLLPVVWAHRSFASLSRLTFGSTGAILMFHEVQEEPGNRFVFITFDSATATPRRPYSGAIFGAVHSECSDRGDHARAQPGLRSIFRNHDVVRIDAMERKFVCSSLPVVLIQEREWTVRGGVAADRDKRVSCELLQGPAVETVARDKLVHALPHRLHPPRANCFARQRAPSPSLRLAAVQSQHSRAWAKAVLQKGLRNSSWIRRARLERRAVEFRLDRTAPGAVVDLIT
jgi:hypothetical protein